MTGTSVLMPLNFLLCIDRNFVLGAGALIASLFYHHPEHKLKFFIFTSSESQAEIKDLLLPRLACRFPEAAESISFFSYDKIKLFKRLKDKVNSRILVQCMRIIAARECQIIGSNLIYLDADIVCCAPIAELADLDLHEHPIAVTGYSQVPKTITTDSGSKFTIAHYFVSGVMVFNLPVWNSTNLDERCIEFVAAEHPVLPDQDALNVICGDAAYHLDDKYQRAPKTLNGALILHFAGGKPWAPWRYNEYPEATNLFRFYCKMFEPDVAQWISFRKGKNTLVNFNTFHARKAAKWLSKIFFKRGRYLTAFYYYWQHLQIKMQQKGIIGIILMRSNTRSRGKQ